MHGMECKQVCRDTYVYTNIHGWPGDIERGQLHPFSAACAGHLTDGEGQNRNKGRIQYTKSISKLKKEVKSNNLNSVKQAKKKTKRKKQTNRPGVVLWAGVLQTKKKLNEYNHGR